MRILVLAIFACAAHPAFGAALPIFWKEIEVGRTVELRQEISLGSRIKFAPGTRLKVTNRAPVTGPGINLTYIGFEESRCRNPEQQHALEIVLPEGELDADRSVGVELGKDCRWGVYVEQKDLDSASFTTEDADHALIVSHPIFGRG